jgi:hypothetical protein
LFPSHFVDGLKDEIKVVVLVHQPWDLDAAVSLALLQEEAMDILKKREPHRTEFPNTVRKGYRDGAFDARAGERGGTGVMVPRAPAMVEDKRGQEAAHNSTSPLLSFDDWAAALKASCRSQGLCFMCGKNWGSGHKCASSVQLFKYFLCK